jgi:hypothetical protein
MWLSAMKPNRQVLGLLVALTLVAAGCGCSAQLPPSYEVARASSPNGSLEAILIETNGGATTSFGYEVCIGPKGQGKFTSVATLYDSARNEQAYGADLVWFDNSKLLVEYLNAKSTKQTISSGNVDGHPFEVELRSGIKNPAAPPGGMQYNLEGNGVRKIVNSDTCRP